MADSKAPARSEDDAEDIRLMQLVSGGDTAAFELLVERHQALVAGTVARMLGSNSEVEDIAQQVFIRVWKSAGRYVARAKFTTWLLKITRNLVFNEMRRAKRHPHLPVQIEPDAEEIPLLTVAYHNYVEALSSKVKNYQSSPLAQYDLRTAELG